MNPTSQLAVLIDELTRLGYAVERVRNAAGMVGGSHLRVAHRDLRVPITIAANRESVVNLEKYRRLVSHA